MDTVESDFDDEDEWQEIVRTGNKPLRPDAEILISKKQRGRFRVENPKASATLSLRRELAVWITANGPRFRLQIGGKNANKIRLTPCVHLGPFETREMRGTQMISLGHINLWPDEERSHTAAVGNIAGNYLVLTLPENFARARGASAPLPGAIPKSPESISAPAPALKQQPILDEDSRVLRAALGLTDRFPRVIGGQKFTVAEASIIEALLARATVSREGLMIATRDPEKPGDDERDSKLIDVLICRIRPKLDKLGVGIITEYGGMFRMNAHSKGRLRSFLAHGAEEDSDHAPGAA